MVHAVALWLAVCVVAPASAQTYQVTDLGSLGGAQGSGAQALNGSGIAVGYSFITGANSIHAMINDHGTVEDLGTLGGTQSWARAVNANGWVVGWAYPPGQTWQRPFLWRSGTMIDLGTFGGEVGDAHAVNDAGLVVGSAFDASGNELAFWWRDGVLHSMGTLGGSLSRALAVNQSGDITGMSAITGDGEHHAFLAKPGSPMYDLGTLGGPDCQGLDVNDLVHVCGWSLLQDTSPVTRGFIWADGVMKSLGSLGGMLSAANGINNLDQVVGSCTRADEVQVAFLWDHDQMVDLNSLIAPGSGLLLTMAYDIDDHGAIVGVGERPDGETRAVLLTPLSTTGVSGSPRPAVTSFAGAMPNPSRGSSRFDFSLARAGRASLVLVDVSGRVVRTLADGEYGAGPQSIGWDGRDASGARVAPGIYHARLATGEGTFTRRFAVVF